MSDVPQLGGETFEQIAEKIVSDSLASTGDLGESFLLAEIQCRVAAALKDAAWLPERKPYKDIGSWGDAKAEREVAESVGWNDCLDAIEQHRKEHNVH